MSKTKRIPEGIAIVTPMLVCRDAGAELDFCKTTFGAEEMGRRPGPDGKVAHALVKIGPATRQLTGGDLHLCRRRGQGGGAGGGRGGKSPDSSERSVLGRPHRAD